MSGPCEVSNIEIVGIGCGLKVAGIEDDVADGDFVEVSCASGHDVQVDFPIGQDEGSRGDRELELGNAVQFKAVEENS